MATKVSDLKGNNRPIDPDVVIPEAVKRAAAAAEAAQRAAYPDQVQATPQMAKPVTNKDGITIAEPAPQPTPEPQPEPQPQPTPQPTPTPVTPTGNDEAWEQRYRSAEGRRVKLEQQLAQAVDRMGAMEQMLQDMRNAPAPVAPVSHSKLITDEETEQFGTEMLDVMGRRAREIVSPEVAELKATVARLEQQLNGTVTETKRTAQQTMHATLTARIPNWQEINQLDAFKAWLALPDPYSGDTRHSMLLSAYAKNDTSRVLAFFQGFVSELAATTPVDDPVATPAAPQQPPKPGLESLAAPGRARTPAQTNAPAEKQIITSADVNAFYAAKRRGEYAGREEQFAAEEAELFKAQREGRVRG